MDGEFSCILNRCPVNAVGCSGQMERPESVRNRSRSRAAIFTDSLASRRSDPYTP